MGEENSSGHRGFKIFIIIIVILSLLFIREENQEKLMKLIQSISNKEKVLNLVDSFAYDDKISDVKIYEDTVVKWHNNIISFLKTDGSKIVDKEFNFSTPMIHWGDNYIYIIDKSTGDIYSLNKEGQTIDRIELEKEIFNFKESNENIIYHWKSDEGENINILNREKVQIGHHFYENKNVLNYTTDKDGKKSGVAVIVIDDEGIKSNINIYGKNNTKIYELDIEEEIVVDLTILSNGDLVAFTDGGVYFIKNGQILWQKQLNLVKDIYIENKKIYILHSNYLETINLKGETESKLGFSEEYRKILAINNNILVYGDNHISIVEDGNIILKDEKNIIDISTSDDKILIWEPEEIRIYELGSKR